MANAAGTAARTIGNGLAKRCVIFLLNPFLFALCLFMLMRPPPHPNLLPLASFPHSARVRSVQTTSSWPKAASAFIRPATASRTSSRARDRPSGSSRMVARDVNLPTESPANTESCRRTLLPRTAWYVCHLRNTVLCMRLHSFFLTFRDFLSRCNNTPV